MNDLIKKARRFGFQAMVKNFEQYKNVPAEILNAGPRV